MMIKKYTKLIALIFFFASKIASAQSSFTDRDFEHDVLYYQPSQRVSDKDFDYAKMILRETKSATENNPANFNVADYFNVLSAFLTLGESEENIKMAFEKFKNANGSCEYFQNFEKKVAETAKYDLVREAFMEELAKCKLNPDLHEAFDPESYAYKNGLDPNLVKAIYFVKLKDQRYRDGSAELDHRQVALDRDNQKIIDKIYDSRKTYIGRNLVGSELETVMWAVIQHSNPQMMNKYLPVIHEAVEMHELAEGPLKMLLDRYYGLTEGYQFFGSQEGVKLAGEEKRLAISKEYGLNQ